MKSTIISLVFAIYLASLLGETSSDPAIIRICCFSKSPGDYEPKCYECPKQVYPNALLACINATDMPKNISYKSADCMEKNCQVQYPTQPTFNLDAARSSPWWDILSRLISLPDNSRKQKRSVEDNRVEDKKTDEVEEVFTFVNGKVMEFEEPEYS